MLRLIKTANLLWLIGVTALLAYSPTSVAQNEWIGDIYYSTSSGNWTPTDTTGPIRFENSCSLSDENIDFGQLNGLQVIWTSKTETVGWNGNPSYVRISRTAHVQGRFTLGKEFSSQSFEIWSGADDDHEIFLNGHRIGGENTAGAGPAVRNLVLWDSGILVEGENVIQVNAVDTSPPDLCRGIAVKVSPIVLLDEMGGKPCDAPEAGKGYCPITLDANEPLKINSISVKQANDSASVDAIDSPSIVLSHRLAASVANKEAGFVMHVLKTTDSDGVSSPEFKFNVNKRTLGTSIDSTVFAQSNAAQNTTINSTGEAGFRHSLNVSSINADGVYLATVQNSDTANVSSPQFKFPIRYIRKSTSTLSNVDARFGSAGNFKSLTANDAVYTGMLSFSNGLNTHTSAIVRSDDGLNNVIQLPFSFVAKDSDNDGLADSYELANGLDPHDANDANLDADNDGLTNLEEFELGTNTNSNDSDGDGILDGDDAYPTNDQRWTDTDTDGDGVTDDVETLLGLDINSNLDVWQDADNDGRPLYFERLNNSDESLKDNDVFKSVDESVENLVRLAYVDAQHLFVDDNTLASLVSQLNNGDTNIALLYSDLLTDYQLAQMGFIGRVYKAVMMRDAEAGGAAHYRKRLNTGLSRLAVVTGFVNSNEFQNRYGSLSNGEFVELVYRNVMNRQADAGGYNYWLGRLDSGASSRADMMLGFVESNEYINRIDKLERMRVLSLLITRHQYSDDELNAFVARVDAEQSTYSVMRELLASDKFKTRVMTGLTPASDDTDGDGVIDGIEFIDGTNPELKDNDVESNDTAFVKQSYRDLMTEQWSLTQVANDVTLLATQTRSQWLDSLMGTDNYVTNHTPVARLFFSAFLRRPDRNGLRFWQGKFDDGMKLKDIANVFASSTEFQNRYGALNDSDFIDLVYQNVLSRNVDDGGKQFWLNKLANGTSRGELLSGFSDSNEGKRKATSKVNTVLLYNGLLQRDPNNTEYNNAISQLDSSDQEGLINTLINMQEYSLRFN